jgi:hypothetical protein
LFLDRFDFSNVQIFVEHLSESVDIAFQRREENSRNQEVWRTVKDD